MAEIMTEHRKLLLEERIAAHASENFKRSSEIRLEALKYATEVIGKSHEGDAVLAVAESFFAFLNREAPKDV